MAGGTSGWWFAQNSLIVHSAIQLVLLITFHSTFDESYIFITMSQLLEHTSF